MVVPRKCVENLHCGTVAGRAAAFTLVELLIVITIIGILSTILFPVFSRARELARRSSCMSNLKQLSLGILQYTQDYDDHFPPTLAYNSGTANTSTAYGWADAIYPYVKSHRVYQCPSEKTPGTTAASSVGDYSDYAYNNVIGNDGVFQLQGGTVGINASALRESTLTVLVAEGSEGGGGARSNQYLYGGGSTYWTNGAREGSGGGCAVGPAFNGGWKATFGGNASIRHLDGGNFAFVDGHVKWYSGKVNAINYEPLPLVTTVSHNVWCGASPFSASGQDPTFNARTP